MKYFTYNLKPVGPGMAMGPSGILPEGSLTGYQYLDNPYMYYGCAEIDDISLLKEYNGIEITKEEFDAAFAASTGPSIP